MGIVLLAGSPWASMCGATIPVDILSIVSQHTYLLLLHTLLHDDKVNVMTGRRCLKYLATSKSFRYSAKQPKPT